MSMHQVGKPPQPISVPFTSTRNTLQDTKIYSFWKGSIPMKTQSQLISPPAPHVFSLPEAHQLKCTAGSCCSPQRTQLPMGREPHTLPTFCSLTSETLWLISYLMINLLLTQNKYENAPVKSVKEATLRIFPPCPYSYWHALCVWVYALGTDSLFLQYSAETQWIITFCLCSEHRKGNTGKKHQWLHLLNRGWEF